MRKFWCSESDLTWALQTFGPKRFECSVECVGGKHLCVSVSDGFDVVNARDYFCSKWDGTRRMLYRRGFECYLMLDGDGIKRFVGRGGRGIRW